MDSQDTVTIKLEIDSLTVEEDSINIKTENENEPLIETETSTTHVLSTEPDKMQDMGIESFENEEFAIKEESNVCTEPDNDLLVERCSDSNKTKPVPVTTLEPVNVVQNCNYPAAVIESNLNIGIKEENIEESLVSYDYPNFDDSFSMDSNEATALGNVEACLQDEVNIKYENDGNDEEPQKEDFNITNVKMETDLTVSETHLTQLTANQNVQNAETGCETKYSFVMKIPANMIIDEIVTSCMTTTNGPCPSNPDDNMPYADGMCNDGVDIKNGIVPFQHNSITGNVPFEEPNEYDNDFQLNSITGNYLSLEQEAYLIKSKRDLESGKFKIYPCPKCTNKYPTKSGLRKHLDVHQTIENYANGRLKGVKTRKKNLAKKLKMLEKYAKKMEAEAEAKPQTKQEQKEGYKCTCGNVFRRRSRMETCLRSHDLFVTAPKSVSCMTCSKKFRNKEELAFHRKRLHRKKFPCKFCPTDYDTRKELFKHLQLHQKVQLMEYKVIEEFVKGKKKLRCFMCSKTWTELSDLKTHVMTDHKGHYLCPHCKNTFPKIIDFGNHTKTYHPEVEDQSVLDVLEAFSRLVQEWKCAECDMQFLEADKLALHQIEKHSPELKANTQFQCPDCRRVFISQKGLTSHRRIHHSLETSEEPKPEEMGIMCLECRKICKDMSALTSHMRLHSPNRKYPCKYCDFRFATPEKRKTHAEVHTGDMKYVCFICEYQCSSENRLKQHKMSLKHANMKEYLLTGKPLLEESTSNDKTREKKVCSAKKRKKNSEESGREKDSESSSSEVACDVCGDKFSSEHEMLEHKQTHPFIEFPNDDKPSRIFFK